MDSNRREELKALIRRLEASATPSASPQDAEKMMGEILGSLLTEDGYTIESVGHQRDIGVDFIARKGTPGDQEADEIAIEYKHYRQGAVGTDAVHRVLGAAVSAGISRAMLVTNARFTYAAREALRRSTPVGIELIDLDSLRSWVSRLEQIPAVDVSLVNLIRRELSRKLISLIVRNPRYLDEIEWREMERLLTEVFEGLGFEARLTPGSKDGGKDIVLTCQVASKTHTYYVEVKHWRSGQRVGAGAISEFLNVIVNEQISGGLYLSTYGFCSNAIESLTEVQRQTLRFGTESKIAALCKSYVKVTSGIWSPEMALPEILYDGAL
ncbi:restriction endonuclease [Rubrivivax gelatinosus]|uniref:Putative restriction endonuclease n=1 Tax=Rubrivivax gelatinosus (strain NBRC 100245 / IL144) TaxID=983917 RepID=I0HY18_RUBGI|nr:restriction endonuclease [Rubrivivax gelatinosus]BAL97905.1 putative restriction endonuclease [Rubrivivax gelatinosus IL144]